ncbi:hypothetical protein RBSWK_00277 [Rhodopirellula baltica SWK14]|uniref:Uncharacterized protein n=1 Tax=Rhodopirellula baltica SWK14 TaxID=993516 RepID=L7CPU9_RHOBT|nr:hypothetical protein RBSWK_00277 [Rhodopirellula baltica SWK14]
MAIVPKNADPTFAFTLYGGGRIFDRILNVALGSIHRALACW